MQEYGTEDQQTILKFEAIAKINDEKFLYNIEVYPSSEIATFRFQVLKSADNQVLLEGSGRTAGEAISNGWGNRKELEFYGYKSEL